MARISQGRLCTFPLKVKSMTLVPLTGSSRGHGPRAQRRATSELAGTSVNTMKHAALGLAMTALFFAAPVLSQRSFSATYDSSRQVKVQGIVTRIDWVTPTAFFFIDVRDATGTVANWAIDIGNPIELERDGWKRSTLHVGDAVTVEGIPARNEARQASAKSVVLTRAAKRLFAPPTTRRAATPAAPAPRWPDGQIRLGTPPGKKGYWGSASTQIIVDNTAAKIPMSDDGLLVNIGDADKIAPFLPWAKALYEYR